MLASIPFSTCVHSIGQLKYTSESNTGFCPKYWRSCTVLPVSSRNVKSSGTCWFNF